MKILVLGATGMAGHTITLYFNESGYNVTAYSTDPFPYCKNILGNAFELESLKTILIDGKYDIVINCIGLLNQVADNNPSMAVYLNSFLPHFIADTLKETKTKLIHMSTDCVFRGNTGPYTEKSFRDGHSFYDRTKALGEVDDNKNLTFRNSIIGPDLNSDGIGLFNWFMKQSGTINGFAGAMWTGVTTITLAKAMEQAAKENLTGIFNLVNNENISKYELLILLNKRFKHNEINIVPNDNLKLDKTLKCTRMHEFSYKVPSYEQMVEDMAQWISDHKSLYPRYFNH
jgi:dTDP-4-dehydrorhamnose reductase